MANTRIKPRLKHSIIVQFYIIIIKGRNDTWQKRNQ